MSMSSTLIQSWRQSGSHLHVDGASTWLWRFGPAEPVVCLHGVPASGFLYRKLLPELAALGLQGVTFDLPGLGLAERPEDFDYRWSGLSDWVVRCLDAAHIDQFHLVVHDIGGPIGFDVCRRISHRVRSLTVLNTVVDVATFKRPWSMEPFAWPVVGPLWLQSARTPMFYVLLRMQGMLHVTPEEARAYGELLLGHDQGRAFLKIMRGFERTDAFEAGIKSALKNRGFPAQVIWSRSDPALKESVYAPTVCAALGLDGRKTVAGKHFLQEDSYAEIARGIAELVDRSNSVPRNGTAD